MNCLRRKMSFWDVITAAFFSFLSVLLILGGVGKPAEAAEKKFMYLMGSTRVTSSHYPPAVAVGEAINKWAPDVNVTVIATGASHDNLKRLRKRDLDIGMVTTPEGAAMSYMGVRKYKTPDKTLRWMFLYAQSINFEIVRADSGVYKLTDLNGKKFHAGGIGFGSTYNIMESLKALGIKPDYFIGSLSDAVAAIKDNRAIGYSKSSAIWEEKGKSVSQLDGTTVNIKTRTPVRIISFTEEEIKVALKTIPGLSYGHIPAGNIRGLENNPAVTGFVNSVGCYGTTRIPQEIGYQIQKAVVEHWEHVCSGFPPSKHYDPVKDTLKSGLVTAEACGLPLHSGTVQYFEEIGVKVPSILIPPEYKRR